MHLIDKCSKCQIAFKRSELIVWIWSDAYHERCAEEKLEAQARKPKGLEMEIPQLDKE